MKNKTQKQNEPIFVHAWKMSFFSSRKDFMFFLPRNKQQQQKIDKKSNIGTHHRHFECVLSMHIW